MKKEMLRKLAALLAVIMLLVTVAVADTYVSDPLRISSYVTEKEEPAEAEEETTAEEEPAEEQPAEDEEPQPQEGGDELPGGEEIPQEEEQESEQPELEPETEGEAEEGTSEDIIEEETPDEALEEEAVEGELAEELLPEEEIPAEPEALDLASLSAAAEGEAVPGGKMTVTVKVRAGNADGALLKPFTVKADTELDMEIIDTNADGRAKSLEVKDAHVSDGAVCVDDEKLEIRLALILPEEAGEQTVTFKVEGAQGDGDKTYDLKVVADTEEPAKIELGLELNADPGTILNGEMLIMKAHISGVEEGTYVINWQCDGGSGDWANIEGEHGTEYSVKVSDDNRGFSWRYVVESIEDEVEDQEA